MAKEKTINVIVIGTNDFDDYAFFEGKLYEKLEKYFEEDYKIVIREQEANATDGFAVRFSKENGCELERYKIQWDELGKRAGFEISLRTTSLKGVVFLLYGLCLFYPLQPIIL